MVSVGYHFHLYILGGQLCVQLNLQGIMLMLMLCKAGRAVRCKRFGTANFYGKKIKNKLNRIKLIFDYRVPKPTNTANKSHPTALYLAGLVWCGLSV